MHQIPRFEPRHYRAALLALATMVASAGCGDPPVAPEETQVSSAPALQATAALSFRQISTGMYHSCGVTFDNLAYCWGFDGDGQLGDGRTNAHSTSPVPVSGGLHFQMVSAGFDHTCGISTDDRVYCWGSNARGQLGDGTRVFSSTPVPIASSFRFGFVSAGYAYTCAVHLSSSAWCWGANDYGQLGDGGKLEQHAPVAVKTTLTFKRVAAGGFSTCGVTTGSKAYCWGRNNQGQLGDGTKVTRLQPVPVAGGLSFRWVSTGTAHISFVWQSASCGVSGGGKAYCWGSNLHGQLGDGTLTTRTTPKAVAGGLSFAQVNSGGGHTCGVTSSGNLTYCWGWNGRGQLGDGTNTQRTRPVKVAGGHLFRAVPVGGGNGGHSCAVSTTNRAYCWGFNVSGQVGDGSTTDRKVPVAVVGPS